MKKQLDEVYECCNHCPYHGVNVFDDVGFGSDDEYCTKNKRAMWPRDLKNKPGDNSLNETNSFPKWCRLKTVGK